MVRLLNIARRAEHLAILPHRLSAPAPRLNMVGVHILEVLSLPADGALATLGMIGGQSDIAVELPDVEILFLASEQVWIDARLLLHLTVSQQPLHLRLEEGRVQDVAHVGVVQVAPGHTVH
mgnify:CR=1 FL=1